MQKKMTTFSSQRLLFYLSCLLDFRENSLTMRQESEHCSFLFRFFRSFLFPLECFVCLKENSLLCMSCRRERERERDVLTSHVLYCSLSCHGCTFTMLCRIASVQDSYRTPFTLSSLSSFSASSSLFIERVKQEKNTSFNSINLSTLEVLAFLGGFSLKRNFHTK